jgi:hypothetical protein
VENRLIFNEHPLEEVFEEYAFNRLSEEQCAEFEEHLLICERCQGQLALTDKYILVMKRAAAHWHVEKAPGAKGSRAILWPSMTAILGAGLVAAALAVGIPHARVARESSSVELVALRGGEAPATARARAGAPIAIAIDTTDLDDRRHLHIQVVDQVGKPVWSGDAVESAAGNTISARIEARLTAGVYWIRLYSASGEVLREFGLRAE